MNGLMDIWFRWYDETILCETIPFWGIIDQKIP